MNVSFSSTSDISIPKNALQFISIPSVFIPSIEVLSVDIFEFPLLLPFHVEWYAQTFVLNARNGMKRLDSRRFFIFIILVVPIRVYDIV